MATASAHNTFISQRGLNTKKAFVQGMSIPPRPTVLVKLMEEVRRANPDVGAVAKLISSDIGLSAAVLQIVNSPLFRLSRKVTSVQQAVLLLGLAKVMSVVRAVSLKSKLAPSLRLDRFWDTAEDVARVCAFLAVKFPVADVDVLYTLGLFHDCGIPIMMLRYPDYKDILRQANEDPEHPITTAESEFYGVNHAEVGYWLGREWFLPEYLCEVIAIHHVDFETMLGDDTLDARAQTLFGLLRIADNASVKYRSLWRARGTEWNRNVGGGVAPAAMLDFFGLSQSDHNELEQAALELLGNSSD